MLEFETELGRGDLVGDFDTQQLLNGLADSFDHPELSAEAVIRAALADDERLDEPPIEPVAEKDVPSLEEAINDFTCLAGNTIGATVTTTKIVEYLTTRGITLSRGYLNDLIPGAISSAGQHLVRVPGKNGYKVASKPVDEKTSNDVFPGSTESYDARWNSLKDRKIGLGTFAKRAIHHFGLVDNDIAEYGWLSDWPEMDISVLYALKRSYGYQNPETISRRIAIELGGVDKLDPGLERAVLSSLNKIIKATGPGTALEHRVHTATIDDRPFVYWEPYKPRE